MPGPKRKKEYRQPLLQLGKNKFPMPPKAAVTEKMVRNKKARVAQLKNIISATTIEMEDLAKRIERMQMLARTHAPTGEGREYEEEARKAARRLSEKRRELETMEVQLKKEEKSSDKIAAEFEKIRAKSERTLGEVANEIRPLVSKIITNKNFLSHEGVSERQLNMLKRIKDGRRVTRAEMDGALQIVREYKIITGRQ